MGGEGGGGGCCSNSDAQGWLLQLSLYDVMGETRNKHQHMYKVTYPFHYKTQSWELTAACRQQQQQK